MPVRRCVRQVQLQNRSKQTLTPDKSGATTSFSTTSSLTPDKSGACTSFLVTRITTSFLPTLSPELHVNPQKEKRVYKNLVLFTPSKEYSAKTNLTFDNVSPYIKQELTKFSVTSPYFHN